MGEFFDEFGDVISCAGEGGVRQVINSVAEGVAFDFFVDRKRTLCGVIT